MDARAIVYSPLLIRNSCDDCGERINIAFGEIVTAFFFFFFFTIII